VTLDYTKGRPALAACKSVSTQRGQHIQDVQNAELLLNVK